MNVVTLQYNILIAEDNDSCFLLLKAILKGYNIDRAINGCEAVKLFLKKHYDIVLMDIIMPEMNGIEATKLIRSIDENVPIYAISAHAFESDKARAIAAGCTGHLSKPVNHKNLLLIVKDTCK